MDDRADDDLGNFAGHDLATEAELRQKEKEARKRKKKKEKKRREREKAWHCWQESERAGAGRGAGSLHAHALDMLGAGDVGSGGDDDDFSSPLNSGRGPSRVRPPGVRQLPRQSIDRDETVWGMVVEPTAADQRRLPQQIGNTR